MLGRQILIATLGLTLLTSPTTVRTERGTLVLIGASSDSIVIASDSLVTDDTKAPKLNRRKIIPISKFAACFMTNVAVIKETEVHNGKEKIVSQINLEKIIADWGIAHPTAQLAQAFNSIDAKLTEVLSEEEHIYPGRVTSDRTYPFSSLYCVGYFGGSPMAYFSAYTVAAPGSVTVKQETSPMLPGYFQTAGADAVCNEVAKKDATREFSQFKSEPAIAKYRRARGTKNRYTITTSDLLAMSRTCLEATESDSGRRFDSRASFVGPPNRYAVIDEKLGFRWVPEPPR